MCLNPATRGCLVPQRVYILVFGVCLHASVLLSFPPRSVTVFVFYDQNAIVLPTSCFFTNLAPCHRGRCCCAEAASAQFLKAF